VQFYFRRPDSPLTFIMSLHILSRAFSRPLCGFIPRATKPGVSSSMNVLTRGIQTSLLRRDRSFTNLLADEVPPAVQVSSITDDGILLADGLLLPSSCIFHDGRVFLWDVPLKLWEGWESERFEFFESTVPRPGILQAFSRDYGQHLQFQRNFGLWNR
jgi:NADH dehydrogenase [ubiquinone] 1 alpha subcomplex assembly factor 3